MQTKTLTMQLNNEQLPILPVEPEAYLSFATLPMEMNWSQQETGRGCSYWRKPRWVWQKPFVRMDFTSIWTTCIASTPRKKVS